MQSAFGKILSAFSVDRQFWSQLIGCSDRQLTDWWVGRRAVPASVADILSKTIGVPAPVLLGHAKEPIDTDRVLPPLWLKAREGGLGEAEHRAIASARLLAARYEEVLALLDPTPTSPRLFFSEIRQAVDPQRPARYQGAAAAEAFLRLSTLDKGATGIGEVVRGFLRARGVLILETPINSPRLEGFCVPVGSEAGTRPCIVVNSYRTTWFRRNYVVLHELAHAIFDLDATSAVFDVADLSRDDPANIAEQRADAFALKALVPKRLLVATQNRGLQLAKLTKEELADLIAQTHAEQGLLVRALREYRLISETDAGRLSALSAARELRNRTYHARGLADLPKEELFYPEVHDWGERLTTFPLRGLRLPIPFVRLVLQAFADGKISGGKAAELLMVKEEELSRYGIQPDRPEEILVAS